MSDFSQGPGWWQASDGKWYPPEQAPGAAPTQPPAGPPPGFPPAGGGFPPAGPPPGYTPGYPAPGGYGAPTGIPQAQLADWPTRAASYAIDYLVLGIVANAVTRVSFPLGSLLSLAALAFGIYNAYLNGSTGQSIGKRIVGTRVVGEATGQPIGGGAGILRWLCHIVDSLACFVGWFMPLWDAKRQTISDKIMKTVVVTGEPKKSFGEAFKG